MLYLALRMARHRIAALVAVACATLGGAAVLTAVGVLAESGLRSHAPVDRLARADVVVSADQTYRPPGPLPFALPERARVPGELTGRLGRLPGVTAAVGDLSFPAAPVDGRGRPVAAGEPGTAGHGWSSVALLDGADVSGTAPSGRDEVAVDEATAEAAGVRPGGRLTVVAAGQPADYRVSAVVAGSDRGVYFADTTARRLAGQGELADAVDLVALRTEPDARGSVAEQARKIAREDGLTVSTGASRGDVEAPDAMAARNVLPLMASSLAGVTVLVVGFIVGGALAVSVAAQRRDLALMRAVGAVPRQVRRLAAAQAALVTLVTLVPGALLGYLLAERFRELLVWAGMLPDSLPLTFSPLPAVAAALLLTGVVWVSAWCSSWRTSRMPATEAVSESHSEPRTPSRGRGFAGMLLIAAATVLSGGPLLARSQAGAAVTAVSGLVAVIGLALAGPDLVRRIARTLARRLPAKVSAPTWLAVANSHGYALRVAGAVTTLAMAVVFTLTYTLTQTTVLAATDEDAEAANRAEFSLSAPALGGLPADLPAAVRDTPGVTAAEPVSATTVLWTYEMLGEPETGNGSALILTPGAPEVLDLDVRSGDLGDLTGATVAMDQGTADQHNASVGERVSVILGDGAQVDARLVATYARGLGLGPVALSRDLAAGHTTTGLDQDLLIRTDGSDEAQRGLAALAQSRPGLALDDSWDAPGGTPPELWINIAVLAVLLGYILLGIANKLIATTTARRHEIAALQLIGATPAQIRAMMRKESTLVGGLALATGLLLSAVPLALLGIGFLGRPLPAGPVWLLPAVAATVAGIAFAAMEFPTRKALRTPPAQALTRG
ncbi:ABC transporter permease [Streptomyces armeniacus]|uniref:ABC transporter permease n=1 Tax=Streptomyces armeniacus TaxID=83291 RepID=A0A345XVI7_9ACTN|nr:ABC transporter permease [Streptomyces armeniacus]AXK35653.1 ABC transporter permease [Streptomyces armeniacus]